VGLADEPASMLPPQTLRGIDVGGEAVRTSDLFGGRKMEKKKK
jgi:hypothetical protein